MHALHILSFVLLIYISVILISETFLPATQRTPHRAASKVRETASRSSNDIRGKETGSATRVTGKGTKNYRIAETRTRRVEREFDDTDVLQRASQIVMYVRHAIVSFHFLFLYISISLSFSAWLHSSLHQTNYHLISL